MMPEIFGPAFFNSDLGLFKNFKIRESMKLQFRIQASNFLNHPLWSMSQGSALNLQFQQNANGSFSKRTRNLAPRSTKRANASCCWKRSSTSKRRYGCGSGGLGILSRALRILRLIIVASLMYRLLFMTLFCGLVGAAAVSDPNELLRRR